MQTAREIVDAIGRGEIASGLGVSPSSISDAVIAGVFPARWYLGLRDLGSRKGVVVPEALFHWRPLRAEGAALSPEGAA
jgi:hypothetical protein